MKRRILSSLMALVLVFGLLPATAFADEGESTTPAVYVNDTGDDASGDGSQSAPYATLAKAVDAAADGATIYVMSDMILTKCARYYGKHLTIIGQPGADDTDGVITVTRGDKFDTLDDTNRSWYNPAMIEVGGKTDENDELVEQSASLRLENIVLDDGGMKMGTRFLQAPVTDLSSEAIVQDAIIATYNNTATITLGDGAVLKNFGGMSAVRIADGVLVMESGSKIIDDTVTDRAKSSEGTPTKDYGAAGAVWMQGGSFTMEEGAVIENVVGRAVYADGGEAVINGTISGIKSDGDMWQGKNGSAIHLRGNNASATLTSTATIKTISGGGSAVYVTGKGNKITTAPGSLITDVTNTTGIYCEFNSGAQLSGEITGVKNSIALSLNDGAAAVLEKEGSIHDNACTTAVVYLRGGAQLTIHGKINNNTSTGNCAALFIVTNGAASDATLEQGGEICNNTNGGRKYGAAVDLQQGGCYFTMNGGTISGNSGPLGAVQVHKGSAKFTMNGGEVTGNTSTTDKEAGIYVEKDTVTAELNAGKAQSVTLAADVSASPSEGHVYISDRFDLESGLVAMAQNAKTVTPAADSLDIKLGNASTDSVTALSGKATANGWNTPLTTFWAQRNGGAELTVGGLTPLPSLPVYALVQETGEDGKPASGAEVRVYSTEITADGIRLTLPNGYANGCAVAIVQPTQDFGTLTISGPETIKQNKTDADYPVAYTVTYVMSESLKNIITQAGGSAEYSLVITKDARLKGTPDSFDENSIQVTYMLPNVAFAVGDSLFASAELTVTVGKNRYVIPSNVTKTKLLGLESFHVVFDWNDGSGKTETVSVTEGEALGDAMIADPSRRGYTFTGWNTQQDGKGSSFDNSTVITAPLTVYAQWSENSSGGGGDGSKTYYYFAIEKVDAQDGHALNGAKFGLYLDGKQVATATSNRSGIALFRVSASDYRKINAKSELYYQELTAPEGYVVSGGKTGMEKDDLTTNQAAAEKKAETVRNYRGSTPDLLNDADHFAYVIGYKDGNVRPYGLISRAETTTIFFRLLKDSVRDGNLLTSNTYTDVADDYWANTAISTMTGLGIVQGRSADTFDPKAPITRAQFAAICARFDTGKSSGTQTFTDIKGHWAEKYIERAAELGWIKGFEDGTFRPDTYITRAQAMTMINRVLNRIPEENSDLLAGMNTWPDCNPGDWFYLAVQEATNSHDFEHKAGNYETWTGMNKDPDWTRYEH